MITAFNTADFINLNSNSPTPKTQNNIAAGNFAESLKREMTEDCSQTVAKKTDEDISGEATSEYDATMAIIKEKGLVAYLKELHAKKVREEVMALLGVTEGELEEMDPEQRSAIEKRIAEETKKRLEAESYVQKENKKSGAVQMGKTVPDYNPLNIFESA